MADKIVIKMSKEHTEHLAVQFLDHQAMSDDATVFLMCVCEDCALYRTWLVTSYHGRELLTGDLSKVIASTLMEVITDQEPPDECTHCVHYREAVQMGQRSLFRSAVCCYCSAEV